MIVESLKKERINIDYVVDEYLKSEDSEKIIGHYIITSHVKPKNIYTEKTDFLERYRSELLTLCKIFDSVPLPVNIAEQIPEIIEFYPFALRFRDELKFDNTDSISFIFNEIDNYFPVINTREYGEYYSNENLINILLDNLQTKITPNIKVIDPSSGAGFFLFHYLKKIIENQPSKNELAELKNNVFGYDIFPFPIIVSKILLGKLIDNYDDVFLNPYHFPNIRIQNTLKTLSCISNDNETFDLIIGNPPYFRIDPHEENNICKCVSYGHNYIHNLFLHWSIQHLKPNGELGFIIPQSILSGFYYQKMRQELMENLSVDLIITNKEHEKSFSVQQDIMLLLATKRNQTENYNIGVSNNSLTNITRYSVDTNIFKNSLKVIPLFKNKEEYENFRKLSQKPIVKHLSSYKIKTGNFVWNQNKESCFYKKAPKSSPLINGPNINNDGINLENQRNSTFPYCIPNKSKYVKNDTLIIYRRMSPIGNIDRMIATIIDNKDKRFSNGYVLENHVNFISGTESKLKALLKFITSREFNNLINSFCHTNQVSSNDLKTIFELLSSYNNEQN